MKKLISILTIFISINLFSQNYFGERLYNGKTIGDKDTVASFLLYCNPERIPCAVMADSAFVVYQLVAYVNQPGTFCANCSPSWVVIGFLNRYKKPFPEKYIIWQKSIL